MAQFVLHAHFCRLYNLGYIHGTKFKFITNADWIDHIEGIAKNPKYSQISHKNHIANIKQLHLYSTANLPLTRIIEKMSKCM